MAEETTQTLSHALPAGFVIQEYEFLSVLGMGGFGITYLAEDANLKLKVAIKEFFPASMAVRDPVSNQVAVKSEEYQADFAWGKERFIQEAQTLAKFSHPSIVHIYRYFVANGTGYMVMDYEEGKSLEDALNDKEIQWDDTRVMEFLAPLLDGLDHVHKAGFLHRDIKPSNIIIRKKDSSPVLLDFGSARAALISHTQTLTALVSPGYCPVEQYFDDGTQGACTDIYSLGAVLYRIVTGFTPTPSPQRVKKDSMIPAGFVGRQKFGVPLLRAIDKALAIEASKRPQSVEAWQSILQESTQKAELKNLSEKSVVLVAKLYKRTNKIIKKSIPPLAIATGIICLLIWGFYAYDEHQCNKMNQPYERARQGDVAALKQLIFSGDNENACAQFFLGEMQLNGQGVAKNDAEALRWYLKAANQGHAKAQANLGNMYYEGWGVPKDYRKAVNWYNKAARQGIAEAQAQLGYMYQYGLGGSLSYKDALTWNSKAALQGVAEAQYNLGYMYHKGLYVDQDTTQAKTWYREAAEQGVAKAQFELGEIYYRYAPRDAAQAVTWYRKAAEQSHVGAQLRLGAMYKVGGGVPQDYAQTIIWYSKAAEGGHISAQLALGDMYKAGVGVPQDYAQAAIWYRKAAELGNVSAQKILGNFYSKGQGVPMDSEMASEWYRKVVKSLRQKIESGEPYAAIELGDMYKSGMGVPQNAKEASKLYEQAFNKILADTSESGLNGDQELLGDVYFTGKITPKDYAQAAVWYRKSAAQGVGSAQKKLGDMYELGLGVPQNFKEASKLYEQAFNALLAETSGNGLVRNQVSLGDMYLEGKGTPKDYAQAAVWYRRAAEKGDSFAQKKLGDMYESGLGVPQNSKEASKLHEQAFNALLAETSENGFRRAGNDFRFVSGSDNGLISSQVLLGDMYLEGKGTPKDYAQAAVWYRRAAEKGDSFAQKKLGDMYESGLGVPKN